MRTASSHPTRRAAAQQIGAALALALVPTRAIGSPAPSLAVVMNSGAGSLSVLDMATRTELRRIPVLREPHHWALTPDRRDLLIGDSAANEVIVLDPRSFELRRRLPISNPYHLGFSPDGQHLVIAGLARNQIDIYEPGTYRLIKRFPIRSMPSHIDFLPDGSMAFVTLQGTDRVVAIDLRRMEIQWNQPVGRAPAGILVHAGQLLVGNMGSDDVAVMNAADGAVLRRIRTGKGAHTVWRAPDGKTLWVTNRLDPVSLVQLDLATLEPVRGFKLPGGPDDLEFAPDGRIWFTMRFAHKVAVLDPVADSYTTIAVGRSPHGIFLNTRLLEPE